MMNEQLEAEIQKFQLKSDDISDKSHDLESVLVEIIDTEKKIFNTEERVIQYGSLECVLRCIVYDIYSVTMVPHVLVGIDL